MLITETFSKVLLKFYMLFCVCMYCADLMVWIDPLIAVSLKTRLPEGYCKCMCERDRERETERERERERERDSVCLNCVCFTELVVWINPLIAVSLKTRLLEGYCKCMCPLGTAFLMPPGWRLHRLGPAIAACSYI